ncbi:hypothetical protein [Nonomuraea sp. NPDC050310]|uniref:hypothetical protein n=1 Tax=unclassified Nonomuraea TaxID=2593643 RepID=UPI00340CE95E
MKSPSPYGRRHPLAAAVVALTMAATSLLAVSAPAGAATTVSTGTVADPGRYKSADPGTQALIDAVLAKLPAGWEASAKAAAAKAGRTQTTGLRDKAINPDDYECEDTALVAYVDQQLAGVDPSALLLLFMLGVLDYPTYDALLFETSATPQHFGRSGEYDIPITHNMRDLRRFWDIRNDDIQLVAMHGSMLRDVNRVARMVKIFFGVGDAQALQLAQSIIALIASQPTLRNGDNPIFTLNAFAFTAEGETDPLFQGVPDKIVMGDGVLEAMTALGLGDMAAKAILAHEYGHHVQFEKGLFDSPLTGPEATRRTELMADALSTYFLTHARGQAINSKRLLAASRSFFEVGDCQFTSNGHHGTPNQRLRSATWAADVANSARPQGKIMPSLTFAGLFDAKLPELVAPDA